MTTVRIKTEPCNGNPEGIVIINKSDYDPDKHTLADADEVAAEGFASMNVAQLKEHLDGKGVEYPKGAKKAELLALCEGNP